MKDANTGSERQMLSKELALILAKLQREGAEIDMRSTHVHMRTRSRIPYSTLILLKQQREAVITYFSQVKQLRQKLTEEYDGWSKPQSRSVNGQQLMVVKNQEMAKQWQNEEYAVYTPEEVVLLINSDTSAETLRNIELCKRILGGRIIYKGGDANRATERRAGRGNCQRSIRGGE